MKNICFRLNEDEQKFAELHALAQGFTSVSSLAKKKVLTVSDNLVLNELTVTDEPAKDVRTYLYHHEHELVKRNAVLHGMSMSREIAIRVRQSLLKDEICLYPKEVEELKQLKTMVNRIGRNIHFIIKGDRFCVVNDPVFRSEVNEVIKLCHDINKTLEKLTTSVVNRFG